MKFRPAWAQRLFKRLAAKHDLSHFEGTAWRLDAISQSEWKFVRVADNGDRLEFLPYTADSQNPSVRYYKKGPGNAEDASVAT